MNINMILATDSYKLTHHAMYPEGTEVVYSYFESRRGAAYPKTVFFGLQALLHEIEANPVTIHDVLEARDLSRKHFGRELFNFDGWMHIVEKHDGRLPLRIKAVPEGLPVETGNVLMTVENTDPKCWWLTNAVESFLTHVWYPSTVASVSYDTKRMIARFMEETTGGTEGIEFMLHDFGYRGAATHEAAAIGGAGHLVTFCGTDTLPAMQFAHEHYSATYDNLAFSVPATEHSIMTSMGESGEIGIVERLLDDHPEGILSVVADSYDYYNFVNQLVGNTFKERILARDGVFVVRPDSVTREHPTPEELVVWTLASLWEQFRGHTTEAGYKVLDPHVRVLWGDGIDPAGIEAILAIARDAGFAASNLVFGMGGGLLQKVNRDTQRFAFKSSAQLRNGEWHDVYKKPLDVSKASKAGRLSLIPFDGGVTTVAEANHPDDLLETVFENGEVLSRHIFDDIRKRAAIGSVIPA